MKINFGFIVCYFVLLFAVFEQKCSVHAQLDNMGGDLNYPCNSLRDCRYFGYVCRSNTCQCDQWYVPDKEKRKCVGGVDQKCLYDEHCIEGAYCMNQAICKCKSTTQPLDSGLVCAGALNLKQHWLVRFIFLVTVFLINVLAETRT